MRLTLLLVAVATALLTAFAGASLAAPHVFAGRALPSLTLGGEPLGGVRFAALDPVLAAAEEQLLGHVVTVELRGQQRTATLRELGIQVDASATRQTIIQTSLRDMLYGQRAITPAINLNHDQLDMAISRLFPDSLTPPQNATLTLSGRELLTPVPSRRGERVDGQALTAALHRELMRGSSRESLSLVVIEEPAAVQDNELIRAEQFARELLTNGLVLVFGEEKFPLAPAALRRLIAFAEQPDPEDPNNRILGVSLDLAGLEDHLQKSVAPSINREAQNARFELSDGRVTQFALPQAGQTLNIPRTISHANAYLAKGERTVPLAVDVTSPAVTSSTDITSLGLTALLAVGESDFAGSPKNRIHNITVGASRYHGLLIPPGQEFSFNQFLGPVDGAHNFLPELVIKENVTKPEFGGGLCQVSTTAFRAALNVGVPITERRNHAYAVRYYGKPGLDATIYPPNTDFKFRNDTPGYILIQTRIDGTKLVFEFWGTPDGREVALTGPVTYDQQPDGAVKAYVTQRVSRGGKVVREETFYSRYKSPRLFPKVLAANGEAAPAPSPVPNPKVSVP